MKMQVKIKTKDPHIYREILVSDGFFIIGSKGYGELPFVVDKIGDIFREVEDIIPVNRKDRIFLINGNKQEL